MIKGISRSAREAAEFIKCQPSVRGTRFEGIYNGSTSAGDRRHFALPFSGLAFYRIAPVEFAQHGGFLPAIPGGANDLMGQFDDCLLARWRQLQCESAGPPP